MVVNNVEIYDFIVSDHCDGCDANCDECHVSEILEAVKRVPIEEESNANGCPYCRDKRGNLKSFFIMTDANKTISDEDVHFCPVCGGRMR